MEGGRRAGGAGRGDVQDGAQSRAPFTLTSMGNLGLASTCQDQGQWKEAGKLEVQAMETRKEGIWPGVSRYLQVGRHGPPRIDIPGPGAMEGGRRAGGNAGHGGGKEDPRSRASKNLDQHEPPRIDMLDPGAMEGG